jgi:hypothetical protein
MKISIKVAINLVALIMALRLINRAERKESLLSIALSAPVLVVISVFLSQL